MRRWRWTCGELSRSSRAKGAARARSANTLVKRPRFRCCGRNRDRFELLFGERGFEGGEIVGGDRVERGLHVGELAAEGVDARELVARGAAFPGVDRAVEQIEVLADAFFAGDGAALFRRDDLLLRFFELGRRSAELADERVSLG